MHQSDELQRRTKEFALRIIRLSRALPRSPEGRVISNQILRSGTAVATNYRSACRSRSRAEFASRLAVVLEEADETAFWLELLTDAGTVPSDRIADLSKEALELVRIFAAARHTVEQQMRNQKSEIRNS